jgi:imidazolonepropionase-like amidohydrolase
MSSNSPTLTVLLSDCGQPSGPHIGNDSLLRPYIRPAMRKQAAMAFPPTKGTSCEGTREAVRQLVRAGVPVLTGTDAPSPGQSYGASVHGEMELLVGARLTPVQALTAATSAPARAFRLNDRGVIAPGKRADLVLVDGDPTRDITATRRIVEVWKKGAAVQRARYAEQ